MDPIIAPPGLKNVVVADTTIGEVRGAEGFFHYRDHDAARVAVDHGFEECWHLVLDGALPDATTSAAFADEVARARMLPDGLDDIIARVAPAGTDRQSMARLRTVLSHLGSVEAFAPVWGADPATVRAAAIRIAALTPVIQAGLYRRRIGAEPVAPDPELSTGANWIRMVTGERAAPAVEQAIDTYLNLTIEHGFNASTFTARVVASTGSDPVSAVCAAIGSFIGPLHGGAPDRALDALDEIGSPDRARDWVERTLAAGDRVMGFGHGVYSTEDPRARVLRQVARGLGGELAERATAVESEVVAALAELKPGRALYVNVEYYAGVVMELCGIPRSMFTPTFACARVVGWTSHIVEQARETKIFRPLARYVGPDPVH